MCEHYTFQMRARFANEQFESNTEKWDAQQSTDDAAAKRSFLHPFCVIIFYVNFFLLVFFFGAHRTQSNVGTRQLNVHKRAHSGTMLAVMKMPVHFWQTFVKYIHINYVRGRSGREKKKKLYIFRRFVYLVFLFVCRIVQGAIA